MIHTCINIYIDLHVFLHKTTLYIYIHICIYIHTYIYIYIYTQEVVIVGNVFK